MARKAGLLNRFTLLSCVMLFISLRTVVLLISQKIYIRNMDVEELFLGNLAMDILNGGPILPLGQYWISFVHGGAFIVSLTAIPIFYLIGTSYLCLKLSALIWPTLTFVLLYLFFDLYLDKRAALISCLLYILPAANNIYYYSWAMVHHEYLLTGILAMFFAFTKIRTAQDKGRKNSWIVVLGLIMGFSVFFWPSNFIAAAGIIILCLWDWKRDTIGTVCSKAGLLTGGLSIGLLPILFHWGDFLDTILRINASMQRPISDIMERAWILLGPSLYASYMPWVKNGIPLQWVAYLIGLAAYAWIWFTLLSNRKAYNKTLLIFIAIYPLAYILILSRSKQAIADGSPLYPYNAYHLRYLSPLMGVLLLAKCLMIHSFVTSNRKIRQTIGLAILFALIVFGAYSLYSVLEPADIGYGIERPGYFTQEIGCRITEMNWDSDLHKFNMLLEQVAMKPDRVMKNDIIRGAAWLTCLYRITDNNFSTVDHGKFPVYIDIVENHVPDNLQRIFKEEIGAFVLWHSDYNLKVSVDRLRKGLSSKDAEISFIGLARVLPAHIKDPLQLKEAISEIPTPDKKALAYAMGQYFSTLKDQDNTIRKISQVIDQKESFLVGCKDTFSTRPFWSPYRCH